MGNSKINETVILFEDDERSLNYKFEPFAKQLKSTKVLSIEYDIDEFSQFKLIGQKPEIGSVYYRHPFKNNHYVNSNLTDFYFMTEKIEFIAHVVKLLGAKSFEASVSISDIEKIEISTNGSIKYKVIEVSVNHKEEETKKLTSKLSLKREFDIDDSFDRSANYKIALDYLKKYNLSAENSIIGIIESRDPKIGNQSKHQELNTELTSEYNSILDFAVGLKVMGDVFNLNSAYNKQCQIWDHFN